MSDKVKMPADGSGTEMQDPDGSGELASRRGGSGESGGGAYPNPHDGKDGASGSGFLGQGGQTQQGYYGKHRLGGKDVDEEPDENAVSTRD